MELNIKPHMTDSHFHIMEMIQKGIDVESVFTALREGRAGVVLDAGVYLDDFEQRLSWLPHYNDLYFSAGIHPNIPKVEWPGNYVDLLRRQINHPRVKAVGETGLDFFREYSNAQDQYMLLDLHYELSAEAEKPLILHVRNADDDMRQWIQKKSFSAGNTAVLHCFQGNIKLAEEALKQGFYFSYAGNVTFRNAVEIRESLNMIPLDKILIETDAPYLSPHPFRGKANHPGMIGYIYDFISEMKNIPLDELIFQVENNLKRFLKLK